MFRMQVGLGFRGSISGSGILASKGVEVNSEPDTLIYNAHQALANSPVEICF